MASLTIDVPHELQLRLQEVASQQGMGVEELVRRTLESLVIPTSPASLDIRSLSREARVRRVESVVAKYAGLPGSVDEFLANKHEDTEREEAQFQERHSGGYAP